MFSTWVSEPRPEKYRNDLKLTSRVLKEAPNSHAGILSILKIMYPGQNISEKVQAIEFENANVIANSNNKDERWIIEVLYSFWI